ncbi:MAG: hypothetical protein IV088_05235 [Hydrogenophaga sp.]|uniref:hypothetical protein n=1 Tax=Hydrogenophaga sp. TaxID=1904254 RepID=UPI0025B997F2|nr:hypothetical protein [Hydrogenophaga sp.]MBT9550232.1 hypothetical protein [Hydrogenophaga sp.]
MKRFSSRVIFSSLLASFFLISCGGGGDVAGDSTEFSVSPEEYALKLGAGSRCRDASETPPVVVTIIGGQPPFRIINAAPEALVIDKTEASGKDPQFRISYSATAVLCANPGVVTVLDYHSRSVSFEYSVEIDEAQ